MSDMLGWQNMEDVLSNPVYEDRYCAFVDILGFTDLIAALNRGTLNFEAVRSLLNAIQTGHETFDRRAFHAADLRWQSISDAICLSASVNAAGLLHIFDSLRNLALMLLHEGYFSRGAVVKGMLYHDKDMVFGEGLVQAYKLEQSIVRYPRIMVAREVVLDLQKHSSHELFAEDFKDAIEQSVDGPHYLHVLQDLRVLSRKDWDGDSREAIIARMNMTAFQIQQKFDESVDNPKHFEKIQWFAKYWNATCRPFHELAQIRGPLVAPPGLYL